MVYVALGFVIASACSFGYAYRHTLWASIWLGSRSRKARGFPTINVAKPNGDHPNPSFESETVKDSSNTSSPQLLNPDNSADKEDEIKGNGPPTVSSQPEPKTNPRHRPNSLTSNTATTSRAPSSTQVNNPPKATMPPPARPGPRLRPKANNPMPPPPSIPTPNKSSTLGVPQTASSLRPLPSGGGSSLQPPPSLASTLRTPPSRSPAAAGPPSSLTPTSSTLPASKRPSRKVLLAPGHSPLDWAHLTSHPPSPSYLRGSDVPPNIIRVPPSLLKYHNGRKGKDAWGVWQGKVYNLTPYLDFHPGGVDELMKGAGREKDGERLFLEVHPWVNWEGLLGECLVGILVSEDEAQKDAGGLEDMD